jgi:hypothetical protein
VTALLTTTVLEIEGPVLTATVLAPGIDPNNFGIDVVVEEMFGPEPSIRS